MGWPWSSCDGAALAGIEDPACIGIDCGIDVWEGAPGADMALLGTDACTFVWIFGRDGA